MGGTLEIKTKCPESHVVMKRQGLIDSLGNVISYNRSFDPTFDVYDSQDRTLRKIQIECPGVKEGDYEIYKLPNGVKIVMEKKAIDETQMKEISHYPIRQQQGTWEHDFNFHHEEGYFEVLENEVGKPDIALEHGVL